MGAMVEQTLEATILAEFDRRRKEGLIFYDDNPEIHTHEFNGFKVIKTSALFSTKDDFTNQLSI
jgi:hypothetical protein